ncbi:HEAT repeat domain-containing protein [Telmatocola sphagniphila]|uniref:HEAT repeat domain-containing protein n=1 Tax=Telmatocola sphagniphila TaxID=1123043 RepID=A0A8E6EZI3_9BACT|nr:PVC-type heme-binding CxxCH protein [Telmatocola sphagniphila]QVL33506.1 HEAT repeat domain-containing protein [Telmatocola sphagniphila]
MLRIHIFIIAFFVPAVCMAEPPLEEPTLPDGTEKALKQIAGFRYPKGLKVELFAAEPLLGSPVAISVDEKGRIFVAEEYRFSRGTEENRTRPFFLEDDLQLKSVSDRLAMFKKWQSKFDGGMSWFSKHADQVRLLEDTSGSGRANHSTVFAGGFNDPLDGLAAGVLAHEGKVYLTNIPNLWLLQDTKKTGTADIRKPLLTGFGVSCAFLGHDLHGLIFGPDGKLYFSIGDRGFNVTSQEGKNFTGLRNGAVFRCDPDGSNFEVVMRGLRNPQELAFDQFGNLFADDNNCDYGDDARLVYVLEGGDAGWNMAYQTMKAPYLAGPWFAERMWHTPHSGQPAWLLPPIGKVGTGPSGFLFTSGSSLPVRYQNSFLMCNYTGNGGLESFHLKQSGAGYEIADYHDFLKPFYPTDVDLGPEGKLYVSDFGALDWSGRSTGGRIFTIFDEAKIQSPDVQRMKKVFAEGFDKQTLSSLQELLFHPEMKLRIRAQFELAKRGDEGAKIFQLMLADSKNSNRYSRLHSLWGMGQLARKNPEILKPLTAYLSDPDAEVRAQTAKVLGESQFLSIDSQIIPLLKDDSLRVRMFAAQALGKHKSKEGVKPLIELLRENATDDPFLRHAAVYALSQMGVAQELKAYAKDASTRVRMGVLLVQRRLQDQEISLFLQDSDLLIRTEAARAIHDLPMTELYPVLADTQLSGPISNPLELDPLMRRIIDANFWLGKEANAGKILNIALDNRFSSAVRLEAIAALRDWAEPPQRDRVIGFWRTLAKRDREIVRRVVSPSVEKILTQAQGMLLTEALNLIGTLDIPIREPLLLEWVLDPKKETSTRRAALHLLGERNSKLLDSKLEPVLHDPEDTLRAEARETYARIDAKKGTEELARVLEDTQASIYERQQALHSLTSLKNPKANELLDLWAKRLSEGKVAPELILDVKDVLKSASSITRRLHLLQFEASEPKDILGKYQSALYGGNPLSGRDIFYGHTVAQCVRCHSVKGSGGTAGPDLTQVVTRNPQKTREYLLESLMLPNAKIALGYANVTLALFDGRVIAGTITAEDNSKITLKTPDGKSVTVPIAEIEERTKPTSSMPAMDGRLTPREIRDLIAYLMTLK